MSFLAGYYDIGLRSLSAAQLGLSITGQNIANASTPGYTRRRVDQSTGFPFRVQGGYLDIGIRSRISRPADALLQASLERERGNFAGSEERLRALYEIEAGYGKLDQPGLVTAYAAFSDRFAELAGQPESSTHRLAALTAADNLAGEFRGVYQRLEAQQNRENDAITVLVDESNQLASTLAKLNDEIVVLEADGNIANGPRDKRNQIVERLSELTGGYAYKGENNRLQFALPGGPTLVSSGRSIGLSAAKNSAGLYQVSSGELDITATFRGGRIGALIEIRDDQIPQQLSGLDKLARRLTIRANALTSSGADLNGNPGVALFVPDPTPATGAAASITVNQALLDDVSLLAASGNGEVGNGDTALEISKIQETSAPILGRTSSTDFLANMLATLGNEVLQTDVETSVSEGLVQNFEVRRDEISGVSLDEEALELIRFQQSYQAAARYMQTLNEVTEITMSIGR